MMNRFGISHLFAMMLVAGVFPAAMASAEEPQYHGPAAFGLNGPVKDVIYGAASQQSPVGEPSDLRFKPNGELDDPSCKYNDNGYPIFYSLNKDGNFVGTVHVEYNADNRCARTITEVSEPMKFSIISSDEYLDGKPVATHVHSEVADPNFAAIVGGSVPDVTMRYSNEEYDSHGNWIRRDVTISMNVAPEAKALCRVNDMNVTETRTITYY